MRYAIISDIHANWQAWQAVKLDIEKAGIDGVICLGDVVGYGPAPAQVLESVFDSANDFVLGNHDAVVCNKLDPACFNHEARIIIEWTRQQLNDDAVHFFSQVPMAITGPDFLCVHAEAAVPDRFEYIYEPQEAMESFAACLEQVIFVGHTHFPGVIELRGPGDAVLNAPGDFVLQNDRRYLVNVGSVGDPRNGDIRASYAIYDLEKKQVQYRNVPFDVEAYRQALIASKLPTRPILFQYLDHRPEHHRRVTQEDQEAAREAMGFTTRFAAVPPQPTKPQHVGVGGTRKIKIKRRPDGAGTAFARYGSAPGAGGQPPGPARPKYRMAIAALLLVLMGLTGFWVILGLARRPGPAATNAGAVYPQPPPDAPPSTPPVDPEQRLRDQQLREWRLRLARIEVGHKSSAGFSAAFTELAAIREEARDTPVASETQGVIDRFKKEYEKRIAEAMTGLETQSGALAADNHFAQAQQAVTEYHGPFAEETRGQREALAKVYEKALQQRKDEISRRYETLAAQLAPLFFKLDDPDTLPALQRELDRAKAENQSWPATSPLHDLEVLAGELGRFPARIMNTFENDLGTTLHVELSQGPLRLKIIRVEAGLIQAQQIIGSGGASGAIRTVDVTYSELSPLEKFARLKRLGTEDAASTRAMRGILLAEAGNPEGAAETFASLEAGLGTALAAAARQYGDQKEELEAKRAFEKILEIAKLPPGMRDKAEMEKRAGSMSYTANELAGLHHWIAEFDKKFASTQTASETGPVFSVLKNLKPPLQMDPWPETILNFTFDPASLEIRLNKTFIRDLSSSKNTGEVIQPEENRPTRLGRLMNFSGKTHIRCEKEIGQQDTDLSVSFWTLTSGQPLSGSAVALYAPFKSVKEKSADKARTLYRARYGLFEIRFDKTLQLFTGKTVPYTPDNAKDLDAIKYSVWDTKVPIKTQDALFHVLTHDQTTGLTHWWVNGVKVAAANIQTGPLSDILVGAGPDAVLDNNRLKPRSHFNGQLKDLHIYKRVLSQREIDGLHQIIKPYLTP